MKIRRVALITIALLAAPAYVHAQMPNINLLQEGPGKTEEQIEQDKAAERAYKETLRKIPDAKASNDPWGSVRTESEPKAKPVARGAKAKPKGKTVAGQ